MHFLVTATAAFVGVYAFTLVAKKVTLPGLA